MTGPLFDNTHSALVFAFHYDSQQYPESLMSKMMKGSCGSGKGLVGLAGAGEAGLILGKVDQVGKANPLYKACLVAAYSPRYRRCRDDLCDGKRMLDEYNQALEALDMWAVTQITGISYRQVRRAILKEFFENLVRDKGKPKASYASAAAEQIGMPVRTMSDHKAKLMGPLKKLHAVAFGQIDELLQPMLETEIG